MRDPYNYITVQEVPQDGTDTFLSISRPTPEGNVVMWRVSATDVVTKTDEEILKLQKLAQVIIQGCAHAQVFRN